MTCNFCWQDHESRTGVDTVREKIPVLLEMLSKDPGNSVTLNIMGGEIFSDIVFDDKLANDYFALITEARNFCENSEKELNIIWVTNLVFKNTEKVIAFLHRCEAAEFNFTMCTSYDSAGRFNINNYLTWRNNLELFKPWVKTISVLLTKPNMSAIAKGDKKFQQLYNEGWYIYFDYYMPDSGWDKVGPTDKDLLKFFYFLIENYPKVHPLNEWITSHVNPLSCRSSKLLLQDGTVCMCGNLVDQQVIQWYDSTIHKNSNKDVEHTFVESMECVTCEYFDRCQLGCFLQHDFSLRRDLSECVFKLTFDKIVKGITTDLNS